MSDDIHTKSERLLRHAARCIASSKVSIRSSRSVEIASTRHIKHMPVNRQEDLTVLALRAVMES